MFAALFYAYAGFVDSTKPANQPSFDDVYARDGQDGTGSRASFVKPPGFRAHQVLVAKSSFFKLSTATLRRFVSRTPCLVPDSVLMPYLTVTGWMH
jgi:hypothetical protein